MHKMGKLYGSPAAEWVKSEREFLEKAKVWRQSINSLNDQHLRDIYLKKLLAEICVENCKQGDCNGKVYHGGDLNIKEIDSD